MRKATVKELIKELQQIDDKGKEVKMYYEQYVNINYSYEVILEITSVVSADVVILK